MNDFSPQAEMSDMAFALTKAARREQAKRDRKALSRCEQEKRKDEAA